MEEKEQTTSNLVTNFIKDYNEIVDKVEGNVVYYSGDAAEEMNKVYEEQIENIFDTLKATQLTRYMEDLKTSLFAKMGIAYLFNSAPYMTDEPENNSVGTDDLSQIREAFRVSDNHSRKTVFKNMLLNDKIDYKLDEDSVRYLIDEYLANVLTDEEKLALEIKYAI